MIAEAERIGAAAVLLPLAAYAVGATPFAWILARIKGVDLRRVGSGNIGATNVGRSLGRPWGYLCFFLDMGKGLAPALVAGWLLRPESGVPSAAAQAAWLAAGCGAILGHVFPFWLRFRGGKGVATSLGVVLGIFPYFTWAGLAAFTLWVAVTLASRYVSLGSIVAAVLFVPLLVGINAVRIGWDRTGSLWPMLVFATVMSLLIVFLHRANIRRLLAGTENKVGQKKSSKAPKDAGGAEGP